MPLEAAAPLLVLIGFMGAGKSTLGRLLADRLGCPFVDLDAAIAATHGSIPEIFAERGESGFRAIEHHQLDLILPGLPRPAVLALGGGAFLQPANRELLTLHSATSIFLDVPFDVICARIAGSEAERPLARDPERFHALYEQRRPSYLRASHVIDCGGSEAAAVLPGLLELAIRLGAPAPARDTL